MLGLGGSSNRGIGTALEGNREAGEGVSVQAGFSSKEPSLQGDEAVVNLLTLST